MFHNYNPSHITVAQQGKQFFFFFFALVIEESQATEQAKEQLGRKGSGVLLDKMMNMTTAPNCSDEG